MALALWAASAALHAQQAAPAPTPCKATRTHPCPAPVPPAPVPRPKSAAEEFPFPGEPARSASPSTSPSAPAAETPAPDAPAPARPAADFPYVPDNPPSGQPGSSSSSSSSSTPDDPAEAGVPTRAQDPDAPVLHDEGSHGRRVLKKIKPVTDADREAEDLDVARYYLSTGNLAAAYSRSRDAVNLQPDDPEAHFSLAESARRLHKPDEAKAEYNAVLKLEPDNIHLKVIQKALLNLP